MNSDYIRKDIQDELSCKIYDARMQYYKTGNEKEYTDFINSLPERVKWSEELFTKKRKEYALFGGGEEGKMLLRFIAFYFGEAPQCIYDNNRELWGSKINGILVAEPSKISERDELIVIATTTHQGEILEQLRSMKIEEERILTLDADKLYQWQRRQYFDLFEPLEDEVFVDGGAYDLESSISFVQWTKGKYDKIYAFEATEKYAEVSRQRMIQENLKGEVIEKGLWSTTSTLSFCDTLGQGSYVVEGDCAKANSKIAVVSIDDFFKGKRVSFIKMDIEGSELAALKGGKSTIIKYMPRLAISIYHKPEDIVEIPRYIKSIVPEYKFYLRTYGVGVRDDTVLYAYV